MQENRISLVMKSKGLLFGIVSFSAALAACGHDDPPPGINENEVITAVTLIFTPEAGGAPVLAKFDDPDGDGAAAPTTDAITLAAGKYDLTMKFENFLETPTEDVTPEILDEADQHYVFLTGSAVDGPASAQPDAPLRHTYNDLDVRGLPVGLRNKIEAKAGMGVLMLTLRHMPPVSGTAIKLPSDPETVKTSGFATVGGSNDVQVNFSVTVM